MGKKFSEMTPDELKKRRIRFTVFIVITFSVIQIIAKRHIVASIVGGLFVGILSYIAFALLEKRFIKK